MTRISGIVAFVLGLALAGLGYSGVLPNLGGSGVGVALLGVLLFGLSFFSEPDAGDTSPMGGAESLAKIFYAPGEVFSNLRYHPKWLIVIAVMAVLSGVYTAAFVTRVTPERIVNHSIEKLAETGFVPSVLLLEPPRI